jgi:cell division protein ZapA (FtsZ GTPase activity inhibitor)
MTILKLKIDNIGYEIECKKGEENLLRKAEELLNSSLDNNPHLKTLSQSKKFLMLSLVLAADLSFSKKQFKDYEEDLKIILNELSELEKIVGIKSV